MKIRMYNVGFGDCFCLRDRGKNLLVDFGSSNRVIGGKNRQEVFDRIVSDLTTIENKNLLLTHFHLDHLSGLLHMMKKKKMREFGCIYLPDVFSQQSMNDTLALLLLADMMKEDYLPSRQVSLFALVEALCRQPQQVKLLSRGMIFEEKYQALWPDREMLHSRTRQLIEEIGHRKEGIWTRLQHFTDKLRMSVYSMTQEGRERVGADFFVNGAELEREFQDIRQDIEFLQMMDRIEQTKIPLRELKNDISIVFQNKEDGEWNLLFTGDIPCKYMKKIEENYDGRIPLYSHYWCIKAPHHGTHSYYWDFHRYTPENLLISNGKYYSTSRKREKAYRVSEFYSGLFYIPGTTMHCSNWDCCEGYHNGCTCKESEIIAPSSYRDIG